MKKQMLCAALAVAGLVATAATEEVTVESLSAGVLKRETSAIAAADTSGTSMRITSTST